MAYSEDPDRTNEIIENVIGEFPGVTHESAMQVGIEAFGDYSIKIAYRFWIPTPVFFESQFAVNSAIFKALREAGMTIPFPQREIRILA